MQQTANKCTACSSFPDTLQRQKNHKEHSEEILNVRGLEYSSTSWTRSLLVNDQAIKWATAKAWVYADSVLCIGRMEHGPGVSTLSVLQEIHKDLDKNNPPENFEVDGMATLTINKDSEIA